MEQVSLVLLSFFPLVNVFSTFATSTFFFSEEYQPQAFVLFLPTPRNPPSPTPLAPASDLGLLQSSNMLSFNSGFQAFWSKAFTVLKIADSKELLFT